MGCSYEIHPESTAQSAGTVIGIGDKSQSTLRLVKDEYHAARQRFKCVDHLEELE